jgi:DNA-binding transcriptional MerR regulator
MVRQIRSLLYDQGFTIGGARQQLSGDGAKHDLSQTHQVLRQMRMELEEILHFLKR